MGVCQAADPAGDWLVWDGLYRDPLRPFAAAAPPPAGRPGLIHGAPRKNSLACDLVLGSERAHFGSVLSAKASPGAARIQRRSWLQSHMTVSVSAGESTGLGRFFAVHLPARFRLN